MTDGNGHLTTYGYDDAGNMTSRTDALGGTITWTYDALGRRLSQRNRTDPIPTDSVQWTYDAAGRMLTRTADSTVTTYSYDIMGNRLTASTGTQTVTATYDRAGRVLTVDDEDADAVPDTTCTYGLTSQAWTDPSGSYAATLDTAGRTVAMTAPSPAGTWTFAYGATGRPTGATQGNGNTVTFTYDAAGRELTRTTRTGGTTRAAYTWLYNRAGMVLSETSTITGDPSDGTVAYGYDPLGRLTASTGSTGYTWDATANRTSAGAATTVFDAADRPVSGTGPTAAYTSDADGRLTGRPGQAMAWDHLGRLVSVTTASGTTTYAYDPLDRLRTVAAPDGSRTRFRYTGLSTTAAQVVDDLTGTVTRSIASTPAGERLADWTPGVTGSLRVHGTNAHHDTTWLADGTGAVIAALRYDPWGTPRSAVPAGFTPFRFQGSWTDTGTDLAWVVTRWYAPALGTFISEDSLLGDQQDPGSRHLYAYGAGEAVGTWDPDGRAGRLPLDFDHSPLGGWFRGTSNHRVELYGDVKYNIHNAVDATVGVRTPLLTLFAAPLASGAGGASFTTYVSSSYVRVPIGRPCVLRCTMHVSLDMQGSISARGKIWAGFSSHDYGVRIGVTRRTLAGTISHQSLLSDYHQSTICYGLVLDAFSDQGCLRGFDRAQGLLVNADFSFPRRLGDSFQVSVEAYGRVFFAGIGWAETAVSLTGIEGLVSW